ncbi:aminomethyl-transferring glycine dehydrogenase subunit GcvPA [Algiphilus sp.]|uniref:aminomethyl-transferring glycine dehydrogenase subunit GcvPA n=1 Tax=Algiphilus sp. TaxID=1872431 RepID=UPI001CA6BB6D|nr:aminomethyl-transferring glycine dehydrogenase subunit GcvPA [Algiphilus sp.]MBY8966250.1 aminomethyl-transferring glycine dehydrogenase subunit GcvPA [Algiphilus acroporae]MCI5062933.1 aminomethyl-transferring glycine dehydrogenase subunit GcvPA [Algiphilus sp.]MCI5104286.1 aminomethyl-transferring glycine dehydrogenase subunit GcvPA [Algiphilus sp.]MCR9090016.1 aminomethyl-transferring glycine dehydrogenase subunit GcvPA [Pseudomonadota bacterium]
MPFVPHTEKDIQEMLSVIGAPSVDALFDEIPEHLRCKKLDAIPSSAPEMEITRVMHERAAADGIALNFIGAGAYEHHIPAAVWEITTRGEFYSAYTPYQAEASQGTLQLLYEFQTMMCELTGMEISNASLYDGASSLAEALLMAVRSLGRKASGRVLLPRALHPYYRQVAANLTHAQGVTLHEVDFEAGTGLTTVAAAERAGVEAPTAVVISQPNFFGGLEDVDALTDWAHAQGALVIAVVNPTLLAVHRPPSEWGSKGADIVVGEGQPLGAPLSSGGPYFGFLCCSKQYVRQMPGRIVGRTLDLDGKPGYTLTLQAREQHIRRSKATSNICTNQGLLVTAATIYMSLLGPEGLSRVANASMANTRKLRDALTALPGVTAALSAPFFHETVLTLDRKVAPVLERLSDEGIVGGLDISGMYPELGNALLVCATETRTDADIARYKQALGEVLARAKAA